jgi:hypothetical protein
VHVTLTHKTNLFGNQRLAFPHLLRMLCKVRPYLLWRNGAGDYIKNIRSWVQMPSGFMDYKIIIKTSFPCIATNIPKTLKTIVKAFTLYSIKSRFWWQELTETPNRIKFWEMADSGKGHTPFKVTRLFQFSPIGWLLTLFFYFRSSQQFWVTFFKGKSFPFLWQKGLGYILGYILG